MIRNQLYIDPMVMKIDTKRLIIRPWLQEDKKPFRKMSADMEVMKYFPNTLSSSEADELIDRLSVLIKKKGFGVCALECKQTNEFAGCVGLHDIHADFHFAPATEILWRLRPKFWGKGYASEAAHACLKFGFQELGLDEIIAYTTWNNVPSQNLMKRLGMKYSASFMHPQLAIEHNLCNHVLYKLRVQNYRGL
ncbi:MAG: GNAT family N-acetyltransferase [Gammaproteobacteria bacterium]|nr:GNAT family N-acetyltransferase [Gammaproteobacteria bacterium]